MKRQLAGLVCAVGVFTSLALPAAYAEDVIAPTTVVTDSNIDMLNIMNQIFSYDIGSGDSAYNSVIQPLTVIDGVNATLVNVINTIVNVNCNIDLSDIGDMVSGIRSDIMKNMCK